MIVTAFLAIGGFYSQFQFSPPRVMTFAVLPAMLLILLFFVFFRQNFIERLSLKTLTWLHIVRIPVEIVLLLLFQNGLVPQEMTFEGRNFDILSGLTAPVVALLGFNGSKAKRGVLIIWNLATLLLLINVVAIAVLSFPSPFQRFGLAQPNVGVAYFPYIWLPTIIVPAVLFSHLTALWRLIFRQKTTDII
jgi:hypothetical protein